MKNLCLVGLLLGISAPILSTTPLRNLEAGAASGSFSFALRRAPGLTRARAFTGVPAGGSIFPAPAVPYDSGGYGARSVAVADVNGDGKADLVVADRCQTGDVTCNNNTNAEVGVLLGNGDGTFQTAVMYNSGGTEARCVAVADVNGDGKLDVIVGHYNNTGNFSPVGVLLGNGDGTFQTAVTYDSGGIKVFGLVVADLNGDGKADLVAASRFGTTGLGTIGVLYGHGDGTFAAPVTYTTGGIYAQAVALADVNGDGHADLLVANQCPSVGICQQNNDSVVGVLLGNGDGTFQAAVPYSTGGQPAYWVATGDFNGDGHLDLVIANQCVTLGNCTSGGVGVLLGNGDGTFGTAVTYPSSGKTANGVAVGDVDGDGKPDLVVVNYCADSSCANGSVDLLLGNGDGTFQAPAPYAVGGTQSFMAALGDVDGDGRLDIVVANQCIDSNCLDGSLGVLLNTAFGVTGTALSPAAVSRGGTATATITVAPTQGYSDTVNLTCSVSGGGTPAPTCSLSPSAITGGSGTSMLNLFRRVESSAMPLSRSGITS